MLLILWRNVICILTLFPGIISLLLMRVPGIRRCSEAHVFLACAAALVLFDVFSQHSSMAYYCLVPIVAFGAFYLEVLMNHGFAYFKASIRAIGRQVGKPFVKLALFPIIEEYVYRFYLFDLLMQYGGAEPVFIVASSVLFAGSHLYTQREKALTKLPFGALLAVIFVLNKSVLLCLVVHLAFNLCIYLYNQTTKSAKYNF